MISSTFYENDFKYKFVMRKLIKFSRNKTKHSLTKILFRKQKIEFLYMCLSLMFAMFKVSKCWHFISVTISGNGLFPGPIKANQLALASVLVENKDNVSFSIEP